MAGFSLDIGKIDGIPIELHWTFLILLIVILFLSLYFFVLWVLLFVCVLIHELIHSITSKRNGIKVNKIVLYPFGGGSIIDFEKVSPEIEFRISIVGPIASLLLGVLFGMLVIYTPAGMIKVTVQALFLLNIFLGVFNLLPWLPLDGGRALRSYLQKKRSLLDATRIAVKLSNVVTVLFVIGTIIYVAVIPSYTFGYKEFLVFFDLIIAFFIYGGAQAELQSALIRENISDLRAIDAITRNYVIVKDTTRVSELYALLLKNKTNIVIFKKGPSIQMLSSSSLQRLLKAPGQGSTVGEFGIALPAIKYNTSLFGAIENMRSEDKNIAVVVRSNRIIGILLMQHIESIVALHISHKSVSKKARQTNK